MFIDAPAPLTKSVLPKNMNVILKMLFASLSVSSIFLSVSVDAQDEVFTGEDLNEPFEIHGRLQCYNGNPSLRICIIGSNRILGVRQVDENDPETPSIPQRLLDIFNDGRGWFTKRMYGDFTVEPLRHDIKGTMRPVRVLSVSNLVVTLDGEVIIDERRQAEPVISPDR